MKKKVAISMLMFLLFAAGFSVASTQPADSRSVVAPVPIQDSIPAREKLVFHFPLARHVLWKDYKQNAASLDRLHEIFTEENIPLISRIVVVGSSSPEGNDGGNMNLARLRAAELRGYCLWKFPLLIEQDVPFSLRMEPFEVTMEALREAILAADPMPCKALPTIFDSAQTPATKMYRILRECDAATYRCIVNNFCGDLRYAVAYIVYKEDEERLAAERRQERELAAAKQTEAALPEQNGIVAVPEEQPAPQPNVEADSARQSAPVWEPVYFAGHKSDPKHPAIAIKTNLLFDLATAVNLEVEIPLGRRWSIAAGAIFPQWNFDNRYCMTLTEVSLEPRLWLGNRKMLRSGKKRNSLTGHFIGVYGNYVDNYDLQWKHKGVMGSGYGAGLTYGYSHRLGRSFNMEYSIGVGALYLENKSYNVSDDYGHKELRKEGSGWHFVPTRAKVSLVWLIGNTRNKTK